MKLKSFFIYLSLISITLVWWWAAFHATIPHHKTLEVSSISPSPIPLSENLSAIHRDDLLKALQGDYELATQLINTWDVDARILQAYGTSVNRFTHSRFLISQILGRTIRNSLSGEERKLKFLPQTYVSASFLMALVPPEQIVAIPKGLRKLTSFNNEKLMAQIPLDIDRYQTENLHRAHPDIAFVARYSDPATVETLHNQGIELIYHKNISSVEDVQETLLMVGQIAQKRSEAELLNSFIDASLLNMDNRLTKLKDKNPLPKVVYIDYFGSMSIPTEHTLKGHMLRRLGINAFHDNISTHWSIPYTYEELITYNPDVLILSSGHAGFKQQLLNDPALKNIEAVKKGRVYSVDPDIQDSPTQYLVLAYFDLYTILEKVMQE